MVNNSKEVNLDEGSQNSRPITINDILRKVSHISDSYEKSYELALHIRKYGDELKKVEQLQRELPLSKELLQEGIVRLEEEKLQCKVNESDPKGDDLGAKMSMDDKSNWMRSAQLWTAPVEYETGLDNLPIPKPKRVRRGGRVAFAPYKNPSQPSRQEEGELQNKSRRCWGMELHLKFLDALKILGGAYVATPKRIRAVMQVKGLTNDQIKSHLQKYRIHLRREQGKNSSAGTSSGLQCLSDSQMGTIDGSSQDLDLVDHGIDYDDDVMQENELLTSEGDTFKGMQVERD
ncbi:Homeodomain-like superfamily protein [Striga hermonthica]|uniref:Homeodomain-like superfamily protein n=1 Tax=Striga hermonthica TaxID=68872 RepID=A0A9N7RQQ7_STRHE|nr:Homeodomain-like superfamily protein [Striga hermonthica]